MTKKSSLVVVSWVNLFLSLVAISLLVLSGWANLDLLMNRALKFFYEGTSYEESSRSSLSFFVSHFSVFFVAFFALFWLVSKKFTVAILRINFAIGVAVLLLPFLILLAASVFFFLGALLLSPAVSFLVWFFLPVLLVNSISGIWGNLDDQLVQYQGLRLRVSIFNLVLLILLSVFLGYQTSVQFEDRRQHAIYLEERNTKTEQVKGALLEKEGAKFPLKNYVRLDDPDLGSHFLRAIEGDSAFEPLLHPLAFEEGLSIVYYDSVLDQRFFTFAPGHAFKTEGGYAPFGTYDPPVDWSDESQVKTRDRFLARLEAASDPAYEVLRTRFRSDVQSGDTSKFFVTLGSISLNSPDGSRISGRYHLLFLIYQVEASKFQIIGIEPIDCQTRGGYRFGNLVVCK